ncbi:PAS domain S-box protein [Lacibacter luteus]|uniref:PAS domain S-box protein n=1 Tax=Lacibacter luteus TaxID=2508719 RepID=UPI0013E937F7|nr:PAS domain S-box protein [Lacibacter luteus]
MTKNPISAISSVILFGALLIALLWVNIFQQLKKEKEFAINKAKQLNANQALALESFAIRTIQNADLILQVVRSEYIQNNTFSDFQLFEHNTTIDQKLLEGVVIMNAHGDLVSSFHPFHPDSLTNFTTKEYFQIHTTTANDSLYISKPITSRLFSKAVIVLSRKIIDKNNQFAGVIALQIFPETFTSFSDGAFVDSFDIVSLIAPDGTTYARKTGAVASYGENIIKSPLFQHLKNKPVDNYFAKDAIRHIPTYFSYRQLKNYPIIATVGKREVDVLRDYTKIKTKSLLFTSIITLLLVMFLFVIIRSIQNRRRFFYALAESEEKYRSMFENSKDAILLTEDNGTIIDLNAAAYNVFKLNYPMPFVRNISEFIVTEIAAHSSAVFYRQQAFNGEVELKRSNGSVFTGEIASSLYKSKTGCHVAVIVIRDATERRRLENELAKERNHREQLIMQQVIQTQEREREIIGGELHDNVCQILSMTKHYLELIERNREISQTYLPQARQLIDDSIQEIRHLSHAINPPTLAAKNIVDALNVLFNNITATGKLTISFNYSHTFTDLDMQQKRAIFRIVQEQLNNVLKHAAATEVLISLSLENDDLHLSIADNGKGFDPLKQHAGLGLNNMEARVKAFAGRITVVSSPGKGCKVEAVIPYVKNSELLKQKNFY